MACSVAFSVFFLLLICILQMAVNIGYFQFKVIIYFTMHRPTPIGLIINPFGLEFSETKKSSIILAIIQQENIVKGGMRMSFSKILSKRILTLCDERNLSINRLATLSGLKQSTVNNIIINKTKNPSILVLQSIAMGLKMTLPDFLDIPEIRDLTFDDVAKFRQEANRKRRVKEKE